MQYFSSYVQARHENWPAPPCTIRARCMALTHPELFTRSLSHVEVETVGEHTRGMTVIDQRTLVERPEPNCDRLTGVDADAAWAVVTEAIAHFSR